MLECLLALFNSSSALVAETTKAVSCLPLRLGGCGLRSAVRTSKAAYWGAWADVLPVVQSRFHNLANEIRSNLQAERTLVSSLVAVRECQNILWAEGASLLSWAELFAGVRPAIATENEEPGSWSRGWQAVAASAREQFLFFFTIIDQ